jgi:uncharacterized membrane protein YfcA
MLLADLTLLGLSGFLAGVANAIAGGGTFLTFGALTLVGIPPIAANATSSITQFPGGGRCCSAWCPLSGRARGR